MIPGIPDSKFKKGSSSCFVIALVIFDDNLVAEECALNIKKLRRELGLADQFEFRFSKCCDRFRRQFLERIAKFPFRIRAIVMRKEVLYSPELRSKKESFYNFSIRMVLQHSSGKITQAKLKMDGHGDREFRRELFTYLRWQLKTSRPENPIIKDVRMVNSHSDVLVQLADMIAGTIRRFAEQQKSDAIVYRKLIEKRIEDVWEFK